MRPRTVLVATFGLLLAGTIANGSEETTAPDVKLYDDLDAATLEGEADKAVSEAQRAVAIDPLDGHATGMLCFILWATRAIARSDPSSRARVRGPRPRPRDDASLAANLWRSACRRSPLRALAETHRLEIVGPTNPQRIGSSGEPRPGLAGQALLVVTKELI